jgi:hypothetical protein
MLVLTSHLNFEDHAGLVLAFGAVLHRDAAVSSRTHEAHLDAATNVVLVRLPKFLHMSVYDAEGVCIIGSEITPSFEPLLYAMQFL